MSDFRSIATVTAALQRMLQGPVGADVPGAHVWTDRPDARQSAADGPGVNIYLYQVAPEPAVRNADLPTRAPDGRVVCRPQAAVTLQYLLSFYGDDAELEPQRVLGTVARTLHSRPLVTRALIEAVTDAAQDNPPIHPDLAGADLAAAPDTVRLVPLGLNLEELSKLWSVFFQVPYALSMAYQASVVVLDEQVTVPAGAPVLASALIVGTLSRPRITRITRVGPPGGAPMHAGDTIAISGERLAGDALTVRVGGQTVSPISAAPNEIRVDLSTVAGLRAGGVPVQVVHGALGETSTLQSFVLHPALTAAHASAGAVTVTTDPPVGAGQRVAVVLLNPDTGERMRTVPSPARTADTDSLAVPVPGVPAGRYAVQLFVDGADSRPDGPVVTL